MYKEAGIGEEEMIKSEKKIYDSFPMTKKEKTGCTTEKATMMELRMVRRKRLIEEQKEKHERSGTT